MGVHNMTRKLLSICLILACATLGCSQCETPWHTCPQCPDPPRNLLPKDVQVKITGFLIPKESGPPEDIFINLNKLPDTGTATIPIDTGTTVTADRFLIKFEVTRVFKNHTKTYCALFGPRLDTIATATATAYVDPTHGRLQMGSGGTAVFWGDWPVAQSDFVAVTAEGTTFILDIILGPKNRIYFTKKTKNKPVKVKSVPVPGQKETMPTDGQYCEFDADGVSKPRTSIPGGTSPIGKRAQRLMELAQLAGMTP